MSPVLTRVSELISTKVIFDKLVEPPVPVPCSITLNEVWIVLVELA